jgi:hypothetical protein
MRGLITAGIRIVLIFIFFQVFVEVLNLLRSIFNYSSYSSNSQYFSLKELLIPICIFLVVLVILCIVWWKAGRIASLLSGDKFDTQLVINTSNTELVRVVLRVFGLCLICLTIPTLLGHVTYFFNYQSQVNNDFPIIQASSPPFVNYFVTDGTKILIGLWLVLGGRGIITAIDKIWDAAHMKDTTNENIGDNTPDNMGDDNSSDIINDIVDNNSLDTPKEGNIEPK